MFKKKASKSATTPVLIPVTSSKMIEDAKKTVGDAVNMFKRAVEQIDLANTILDKAKDNSIQEISALEASLIEKHNDKSNAEEAIKGNNLLKDKLNQFIV